MSTLLRIKEMKVGDMISVYDKFSYSSEWCGATVLEINKWNNCGIKIKFRHRCDAEDKWIDRKTVRLDINKWNIKYIDCQIFGIDIIPPDPCYYNNKIIISIDNHDTMSPGIYSYDINNDKCMQIAVYPDELRLDRHTMAIDKINDNIYLFGGRSKSFAIYNIFSKTWKIKKIDNMPDIRYPKSIYIEAPFDEMYFMGIDNETDKDSMLSIIKWSQNEKDSSYSLINIMSNFHFTDNLKDSAMIYDEDRQRIMLFGGISKSKYGNPEETIYFDDIWVYDIGKTKEWHLLSVKLPHHYCSSSNFKVIHAFNSIVFVLYLGTRYNEIWCLDLLSNQWFKSHLNLPKELKNGDMIVTDNNYLHCMCYDKDIAAYHIKINLKDIIPHQLYTIYWSYYDSLISAIFEYEQPDDLKRLIAKYCHAFW